MRVCFEPGSALNRGSARSGLAISTSFMQITPACIEATDEQTGAHTRHPIPPRTYLLIDQEPDYSPPTCRRYGSRSAASTSEDSHQRGVLATKLIVDGPGRDVAIVPQNKAGRPSLT